MNVDLVLHRLVRSGGTVAALTEMTVRSGANVCLLLAGEVEGLAARVVELSTHGRRVVCGVLGTLNEEDEWRLLDAGAVDCVGDADSEASTERLRSRLKAELELMQTLDSPLVAHNLVGSGGSWRDALARAAGLAKTQADVLLTGEPGTGKELVARLIHALDPQRSQGPLVVLDCSTLVPELSGSEFFGHERGAFTGAVQAREGAFAQANGGTLFLDEVGELPLPLQAQLLRAVQERSFKKVGSNQWEHADFRLVCATNRRLETLVERDAFRADFFHRIASSRLHLPPLRERREDIEPLAVHFASTLTKAAASFAPSLMRVLLDRGYAGNVRELKQLVTRLVHRHAGPMPLTLRDLPPEDRPSPKPWHEGELEVALSRALGQHASLRDIGRVATDTAIRLALEQSGTLPKAAAQLQVSERTLQLRRADARAGRDAA